jgi:hypothetical protein
MHISSRYFVIVVEDLSFPQVSNVVIIIIIITRFVLYSIHESGS